MEPAQPERWTSGDAYDRFMGRWSGLVALEFLDWLGVASGARWLDVGCGSGSLTRAVLDTASPAAVLGIDPSAGYLAAAREQTRDLRAGFARGDARALPCPTAAFDVVAAGLALNFVSNPLTGCGRDAAGSPPPRHRCRLPLGLCRRYGDAAAFLGCGRSLDAGAAKLDEGRRFPLCRPEPLTSLFHSAGLTAVEVRPLDLPTTFRDFDDLWEPFLSGQGPAPAYVAGLGEAGRTALRDRLSAALPRSADGAIRLTARAWAVRGEAGPT